MARKKKSVNAKKILKLQTEAARFGMSYGQYVGKLSQASEEFRIHAPNGCTIKGLPEQKYLRGDDDAHG